MDRASVSISLHIGSVFPRPHSVPMTQDGASSPATHRETTRLLWTTRMTSVASLQSLVIQHPSLARRETCIASLQDLQRTRCAIQGAGGEELTPKQRRETLESLTRRSESTAS